MMKGFQRLEPTTDVRAQITLKMFEKVSVGPAEHRERAVHGFHLRMHQVVFSIRFFFG